MGKNGDEERKVNSDCRNASNQYHECSEYCFKIIAEAKKRINKCDGGMVIRASLVQKALKQNKEKLMARARASLGTTTPPSPASESCDVSESLPLAASPPANPDLISANSTGVTSTASYEHGEPSDPPTKDKPKGNMNDPGYKSKSKRRSKSGSQCEDSLSSQASKKVRQDKQPDPTELENALQQLEIQRKVVNKQRSELRAQSGEPPQEFGGDRIVPNWSISSQSSVVKTRAGEDSFELYRACLLPIDQITLAPMAPCKLEEIAAHDLMRVAAVTHHLTLQCTMWQREQMELLKKVAQLEREKHEVESRVRAEYAQQLTKLERLVFELKAWTEKAEKALLKSNIELKRLEQECTDSFNAGRAAGGREFAESEEYQEALRKARLSGMKDFKKSPTFERILATKAAEYEVIGFMKCQSQIFKLGGFKPGFDPGLLDWAKDGNLKSPTVDDDDDAPEIDDPEFCFLAEETGVEHPTR